ncbi:hypothetical protein A3842_10910 [Paenibacillus sp. P3E]|uniref:hypothetical protein n=1 Tax=Paenibacillus sp. P3E TaxID=1349435 RepID=UPI00093F27FC|nr:hypothetical protein [Paenibacillus sp. P3E]OKP81757.1 hypothetical protein A3842_10910 [Paenibacillus sp. P3E]
MTQLKKSDIRCFQKIEANEEQIIQMHYKMEFKRLECMYLKQEQMKEDMVYRKLKKSTKITAAVEQELMIIREHLEKTGKSSFSACDEKVEQISGSVLTDYLETVQDFNRSQLKDRKDE